MKISRKDWKKLKRFLHGKIKKSDFPCHKCTECLAAGHNGMDVAWDPYNYKEVKGDCLGCK